MKEKWDLFCCLMGMFLPIFLIVTVVSLCLPFLFRMVNYFKKRK